MALPADLPARFRAAGLTVEAEDGWRSNGRPGPFGPVGVLNHHTGGSANDRAYARWMFNAGRSDLPAPLCHISINRQGVVYVGAGGRANHAGRAKSSGSVAAGDGNSLYIGIEWMLTGTETISDVQYRAGVTANAVLTQMLGNSVDVISCHYQTSVTGKWDIGDPQGIPFKGKRVLDVDKFRRDVQVRRTALYSPKPKPPNGATARLRVAHVSLRWSLTQAQKDADADAIFSLGYDWITGTEALEVSGYQALLKAARKYGYTLHRPPGQDCWISVRLASMRGRVYPWYSGTIVKGRKGKHSNLGLPAVRFQHRNPRVGWIGVGVSHYTTKRQDPSRAGARRIAGKINALARNWGRGADLFFAAADANMVDRTNDVFFGGPLRTCWDDMRAWPDTGHGNIDVIARHTGDARVSCVAANVIGDSMIHLHTDHKIVQASYDVILEK